MFLSKSCNFIFSVMTYFLWDVQVQCTWSMYKIFVKFYQEIRTLYFVNYIKEYWKSFEYCCKTFPDFLYVVKWYNLYPKEVTYLGFCYGIFFTHPDVIAKNFIDFYFGRGCGESDHVQNAMCQLMRVYLKFTKLVLTYI